MKKSLDESLKEFQEGYVHESLQKPLILWSNSIILAFLGEFQEDFFGDLSTIASRNS